MTHVDGVVLAVVLGVAMASGTTAAIVGFGIGSMLTPVLAARMSMPEAIALVSVPHAVATAVRLVRLRGSIHVPTLRRFGVPAALGGVCGGLLFVASRPAILTVLLAVLLLATAGMNLAPSLRNWRPPTAALPWLGACAGLFGGLAGNQGGLRAAALAPLALSPVQLLATSTAIALSVDVARLPAYLGTLRALPSDGWRLIGVATAGCLVGTFAGEHVIRRISRERYRRVVAIAVAALGLWLLSRA